MSEIIQEDFPQLDQVALISLVSTGSSLKWLRSTPHYAALISRIPQLMSNRQTGHHRRRLPFGEYQAHELGEECGVEMTGKNHDHEIDTS